MAGSLYNWVDERVGLTEAIEFARHKRVPAHAQSFWYYWGGISLFLFLVQIFTGILLLVYYRPGAEAFESVRQITYVMHFGWLVRSAHSWSANLLVFAVLVHMFSVYFMKAYRQAAGDRLAYRHRPACSWEPVRLQRLPAADGRAHATLPPRWACRSRHHAPVLGPAFTATILRGGPDVGEVTVQRFFALHVVILPLLFLPLLGVPSVAGAEARQRAAPGRSWPKPESKRQQRPIFPELLCTRIWPCG